MRYSKHVVWLNILHPYYSMNIVYKNSLKMFMAQDKHNTSVNLLSSWTNVLVWRNHLITALRLSASLCGFFWRWIGNSNIYSACTVHEIGESSEEGNRSWCLNCSQHKSVHVALGESLERRQVEKAYSNKLWGHKWITSASDMFLMLFGIKRWPVKRNVNWLHTLGIFPWSDFPDLSRLLNLLRW